MKTSVADRLDAFWWRRLPLLASKVSPSLGVILADGEHITSYPGGGLLPPLVLLLGFVIGWRHFFPGITYTFSISAMMVLLAISSFGAGIGFWLWLGYALGDFWLFPHPKYDAWFDTFKAIQIPLLVSYTLLAALLVSVPLLCTSIRQQTVPFGQRVTLIRVAAGATLQALLQGAFVYIWVQSIPILIRPLYTWQGQSPVVEAIQPLQLQGHNLVVIAAILGGVRVLFERFAMTRPGAIQQTLHLQEGLRALHPYLSLPPWIGLPLRAAFTTIVLSGTLHTQEELVIFGMILTLVLFLREGLLLPIGLWRGWISRVPLLLRLIAAILLNYYLAEKIVKWLWNNNPNDSFRPIAITAMVGILVFSILIPAPKTKQRQGAAALEET